MGGDWVLILGEVHTGLLQNSAPLSTAACQDLLALCQGEVVRRSQRPIAHAASPALLTGVDCRLPTASGARARGVGTVSHRASITGGRVVQGSAAVEVARGGATNRLPWSHYLALPGRLETIGKADHDDLARGFVSARPDTSTLDLGAISGRTMDDVQASARLDRCPPFRAPRTRLRWVAIPDAEPGGQSQVALTIESPQLRTLWLRCPGATAAAATGLCEDLAVHDWLLTTLLEMLERSQLGAGADRHVVDRLRPAVEHLLHLWMPAARVTEPALAAVWESLERRPGLSRQWQASVARVRDQLAVSMVTLLGADDARRDR